MFAHSAALAFLSLSAGASALRSRAAATPKVNPDLADAVSSWPFPAIWTEDVLPTINSQLNQMYTADYVLSGLSVSHEEYNFTSYDNYTSTLSVFTPSSLSGQTDRRFVYYIHGGGLVAGNRFFGIDFIMPTIEALNAVLISVEYRLAPDHPAPAAIQDVYHGLTWAVDHAETLGLNASNAIAWGTSAGGGLTAALGMMVRDKKPAGVSLNGLLMHYPMLDNAIPEEEKSLFSGESSPVWSSESDTIAWKAYLGSNPSIFIDVGSAELFRKPALTFAEGIWEAGGLVEVHVTSGGYHGSDLLAPTAPVSERVINARKTWAMDVLSVV
ncbi:hypothetical protein V2G26_011104 [Clonostachys chloroleuca]